MRSEPNYVLLGAAVTLIAVLFFGVVLFVAGGGWGRDYQTVFVKFPHDLPLPPLASGATVTCGGMNVGTVESAKLAAFPAGDTGDDRLFLLIEATVDRQVGLRTDCRIRAEAPPLGGGGNLVIVHRGHADQVLADKQTVEGLAPTGLNAVVGQLGDTLAAELDSTNRQGLLYLVKSQLDPASSASLMFKVNAIADDLVATAGQIRTQLDADEKNTLMASLDDALTNVKAVTAALRAESAAEDPAAMFGKLHAILASLGQASRTAAGMLQDNRQPIEATMANVRDSTAAIKDGLMPAVMAQLDPHDAVSLLGKFHTASDTTNQTLRNIEQMSTGASRLLTVNRDSIDATIANLLETSDHLRAASREIRRNPWRLLYRPGDKEFKEVAVADAARSFSDAAGKLDAAFARLQTYVQSAGPSLPADDAQLHRLQDQLGTALEKLSETEKQFWQLLAEQ